MLCVLRATADQTGSTIADFGQCAYHFLLTASSIVFIVIWTDRRDHHRPPYRSLSGWRARRLVLPRLKPENNEEQDTRSHSDAPWRISRSALFLEAARWLYSRSGGHIRTEVPNEACNFSCDV